MKKLLLFLALCGTGSFVVSMGGEIAEMDGSEDNGSSGDNSSNDGNPDRTEEKQMLDGQTPTEEQPPEEQPQRRRVSWGDGEETGKLNLNPTNDQDTAQDGAAAFNDAGQGTEAEIEQANRANAENLQRGLDLAPDRLAQIDGNDENSGFWGNQPEDDGESPVDVSQQAQRNWRRVRTAVDAVSGFKDGLTPDQIQERNRLREETKEGVREMDGSIQERLLNETRAKQSSVLRREIDSLKDKYDEINDRFDELAKQKFDVETKPKGDEDRETASADLVKIKEEEKQFYNKRNDISLQIDAREEVLEERQKILEDMQTSIDNVDSFREYKKGTRTRQEYDQLQAQLADNYNNVQSRITNLERQEAALGVTYKEVKKRGWFGRSKTIIVRDTSNVSEENMPLLQEVEVEKQHLQDLQKEAGNAMGRLKDTDPNNSSLIRRIRMRSRWGFLSESRTPDRYSTDDWNRLGSQGRRNLSDDQLRGYAKEIDPYGQPLREVSTPEDRRRIKDTLRAREQLRQESDNRGRLLFKSNAVAA